MYWNEYAVATVAGVAAAVVPVNAETWSTTMVKLSVASPPMPLAASMTPLNVPTVVGVPENRPVELSVRPLGSVPEPSGERRARRARGRVLERVRRGHGCRRRGCRGAGERRHLVDHDGEAVDGVATDAVARVDGPRERLPSAVLLSACRTAGRGELSVRPLGSVEPPSRLNVGLGVPVAVYWNE